MRAVLAALAFYLPQALAQAPAPPELAQFPGRFIDLFRQGNLEGIVALFAPDATFVPIVGPARLDGHAGVRWYFARVFDGSKSRDISILGDQWQSYGDTAIRTADVLIAQELAAGGSLDTRARITFVFRRQGGTWSVVHYHGSQQPQAPKPAADSLQCGKP